MITIEYCENGTAVSDFNYSDWLYNVIKNAKADHTFLVSTSLPINLVRLAIIRDELDYRHVYFLYCGYSFQANEYGVISNWPHGFCDRDIAVSEDILRYATKKKKTKEAENK